MTQMHGELIPGKDELRYAFYELQEIRTRRDGPLLIGLCLDEAGKTVIFLMDETTGAHLTEPVAPQDANQAFEQPFAYVSEAGQGLLSLAHKLQRGTVEDYDS